MPRKSAFKCYFGCTPFKGRVYHFPSPEYPYHRCPYSGKYDQWKMVASLPTKSLVSIYFKEVGSTISLSKEKVQCACSYKSKITNLYTKPPWLPEYNAGKEYEPSYNIAPTDVTPVLISSSRFRNVVECDRVLKPMMWGIIPPWHKGNYKTHNLSTNNCRLENIKSSKLYSPILSNGGRCIIVAEGFYEWQTTEKFSKVKKPYYIYAPQSDGIKVDELDTWNNSFDEDYGWRGIRLLYMAGLYHVWQHEGTVIYSYSVITMDSNNTLEWLHHRMPAILDSEEQIEAWLDIDNVKSDMAVAYLKPVKLLSWHPVSSEVNNSKNKTSNCHKRLSDKEKYKKNTQKTLNSWFVKVEKRKLPEDNNPEAKKTKK